MYMLILEINDYYSVKKVTKVNLTNAYKIIQQSANQKLLEKIAHHLNYFVPYVPLYRISNNYISNVTVNEISLNVQCPIKCETDDDVHCNNTKYNADESEMMIDEDDYGNFSGFGSMDEIKIDELSQIDEKFINEIMNQSMYHHNKSDLDISLVNIDNTKKADTLDDIKQKSKMVPSLLSFTNTIEISVPSTSHSVDNRNNMHVVQSGTRKTKQNFCYYCKTMQQVISRHLVSYHKNEVDVKAFSVLPKGNTKRKKIIQKIRLNGNHIFNSNPQYNEGELLVRRQPNKKWTNDPNEYKLCENCCGYYTKLGIVKHRRRCLNKYSMNA